MRAARMTFLPKKSAPSLIVSPACRPMRTRTGSGAPSFRSANAIWMAAAQSTARRADWKAIMKPSPPLFREMLEEYSRQCQMNLGCFAAVLDPLCEVQGGQQVFPRSRSIAQQRRGHSQRPPAGHHGYHVPAAGVLEPVVQDTRRVGVG